MEASDAGRKRARDEAEPQGSDEACVAALPPPAAADAPAEAPAASEAAGAQAGVAAMAVDAPPAAAAAPAAKGKGRAPKAKQQAEAWGDKLAAAHAVFLSEKTSRRMYRLCVPLGAGVPLSARAQQC